MHHARRPTPDHADFARHVGARVRAVPSIMVAVAAVFLLAALADPAAAQRARVLADGQEDYEQYCAACHGPNGEGDGSMADILVIPPADLTQIAARNDGEFPFWRIYAIIQGEEEVQGHDTFQMPLAQARFERFEGRPGFLPTHVRLLQLTHFVESLQKQ